MESCPITQNPETKKGKRLVNFIFIKMENFPWPKKRVSIVKDKVKKKKKKKSFQLMTRKVVKDF